MTAGRRTQEEGKRARDGEPHSHLEELEIVDRVLLQGLDVLALAAEQIERVDTSAASPTVMLGRRR